MSRRLPDLRPRGAEGRKPHLLAVPAAVAVLAVAVLAVALSAASDTPGPPVASAADSDCWDDASCAATAAGYVVLDPRTAPEGAGRHEWCLMAADDPYAGFPAGVCEPLSPFHEPGQHVYTGRFSYTYQDATVEVPPLEVSVADSCADADDLGDCVRALIEERREHSP